MSERGTAGRMSQEDYLARLEGAMHDDQDDKGENPGDLSEAEQMAALAEAPRMHRRAVIEEFRVKDLTSSQLTFAQCLIEGKTYKEAYRQAYPNAQGADATIMAAAYKLAKDERITKMRQDAWEMTADNLIQDNAATRRYVMAQLIAHSKSAQTDAVRIKALELMGKAIGLFTDRTDLDAKQSTPEQLKRELAGHLKLLERKRA